MAAVPAEAGHGVGQDQVHRRREAGNGGLRPLHGVAADEGVHGGLHEPGVEVGHGVDALGGEAQVRHQVPAPVADDAHQDPVDGQLVLPEEGGEKTHPAAGVEEVIHQDGVPAEGADHADLAKD